MGFLKNIFKFNNLIFKKLLLVFVFSVFLIQILPINTVYAELGAPITSAEKRSSAADRADGEEKVKAAQEEMEKNARNGACFYKFGVDLENCVNQASFVAFKVATFGVSESGGLMDTIFDFTVINFEERVNKGGLGEVMVEGWEIFRDLANIAFIFILLYAAISIIIGMNEGGAKKIVGMVVIIAILINFSYFLTGIIIDTSNRLAFEFHKAIQGDEEDFEYGLVFITPLKLGKTYTQKEGDEKFTARQYAALIENNGATNGGTESTVRFIMGTIFLLVAIFVFVAISILFIGRLVVLIFMLMLSPLAFVAKILPNTQSHFDKWLKTLLGQAFFAPVFFMLLWITIRLITSDGFGKSIGLVAGGSTDGGVADSIFAPVIGFSVAIGFLIFSLVAAQKMGVAGASGAISRGKSISKWGQKKLQAGAGHATFGVAGFAGRQTVGRGAAALGDVVAKKYGSNFVGRAATRGLRGVAGSSFDGRNAPIVSGAAAAAGLGAAGGKGGYTGGVGRDAKKRADQAKAIGAMTVGEQRSINKSEQDKKDREDFVKEMEGTDDYKDADKAIKDSDKKMENAQKEIAKLKEKEDDAAAQGDGGLAANYAANRKHLEGDLKGNLANENKALKTTLEGIKDVAVKNSNFDENTFEGLEEGIESLENTIKTTKGAGAERQQSQIDDIGRFTSYISGKAGMNLNRDRIKFATEKSAAAKPKKKKKDKKEGEDKEDKK